MVCDGWCMKDEVEYVCVVCDGWCRKDEVEYVWYVMVGA